MGRVNSLVQYSELVLTFLQYISLVNQIEVAWPEQWRIFINWTDLININLRIQLPNFPVFDFRVHFIFMTIVLPLLAAFFMLIIYNPFLFVIWYFILLTSLAVLLAGLVLLFLPSAVQATNAPPTQPTIIAGAVGLVLCAILYFTFARISKKNRRDEYYSSEEGLKELQREDSTSVMDGIRHAVKNFTLEAEVNRMKEREEYMYHRSTTLIVRDTVITTVLVVAGLASIGLLNGSSVGRRVAQTTLSVLGDSLGTLLIVLAAIAFGHLVLSLFPAGRSILWSIKKPLRNNFVKVMVVLLTLLYIPITNTIMNAVVCQDSTCPAGTTFYDKNGVYDRDSTAEVLPSQLCEPCNFQHSCPMANTLCPGGTQARLAADVSFACQDTNSYLVPIAGIMTVAFVLGVPAFYARVVRYHYQVLNKVRVETAETWDKAIEETHNTVKHLYAPFEEDWVYWKIGLVLQKLFIVLVLRLFTGATTLVCILTVAIHLVAFVWHMYAQPYIEPMQDLLSTATNLCNTLNAIAALLLVFRVDLPVLVFVILVFVNLVLPIVGLIVGKSQEIGARDADVLDALDRGDKVPDNANAGKSREVIEKNQEAWQNVDYDIIEWSNSNVSRFFVILGVFAFLALVFALVGVLNTQSSSTAVYHSFRTSTDTNTTAPTQAELTQFEFVGYSNWQTFSNSCCCQPGPSFNNERVELWRCSNGFSKQRLRVQDNTGGGGTQSGLALRPFCSRTFAPGVCEPSFDVVNADFRVVLSSACGGSFNGTDPGVAVRSNLW